MGDLAGMATGKLRPERRSKRLVGVGVSVVLLAAACTSNGEIIQDQPSLPLSDSSPPATSEQPVSDDLGGSSTSAGATVVRVESDAEIIEPGAVASFSTRRRLTGELRLVAPTGSELIGPFIDGRAEIPIPDDAPEGEYLAVMEGDDGALGVGSFLVAAGPSVWLRSDRRSVGPADDVLVRLSVHGVKDDALVLFGWGDLDLASYVDGDGGEEGEPLGFLVPDRDGFLQPGYDPVPLQDWAGRSLLMSGMQVAGLQALVIDPDGEETLYSNFLPLAGCAESSRLSGTIGGPGALRVLSTGDGLRSAGLITGDGTFSIDAPHGLLAVFGARDDGRQIEPLMFDVPCGAVVVVDLEHGDFEVTVLEEQGSDDAEFPGDGGTLTFTGDIETEFLVEPFCDHRGSEIKIAFATYDPDVPAVLLFVEGGEDSGPYDGRLEIRDWSKGGAQSEGLADIGVSYSPGALLAEGTFELDARYSGAAGDGAVTGEFTCTVLGLATPASSDQPVGPMDATFDPLAVAPVTSFDARGPDPAVASPACRNLVIDDGGDHVAGTVLAATLRQALPRAAVATRSELDWLLDAAAGGYAGPGFAPEVAVAVAGASPDLALVPSADGETVSLLVRPMIQEPRPDEFDGADAGDDTGATGPPRDGSDPWTVADPLQGVSRALSDGVLCVDVYDVWAVPGEAAQLLVMVTDLAGEPVDGVTVRIGDLDLGTVDPSVGTTSGGAVQATLLTTKSGSASVGIEAGGERWRSTIGFAHVHSASSYSLEGQYRVVLNPEEDGPIAPGPLSVTLGARSCSGMSGAWRGIIFIEAGPYLSLIQTAGVVTTGLGVSLRDPAVSVIGGLGWLSNDSGYGIGPPTVAGMSAEFIGSAFGPLQGIDLSSAIPVPVTLYLPPVRGPVDLEVAGFIGSGFAGRYDGRMSLVQVSVNGLHLLTARIRPADACDPFELDQNYAGFLDAFEQWSDELNAQGS